MANIKVSLTMVYDALNRVSAVTNQTLGETITYGYDETGNRTSMDGPLGQVQYRYDAKNRLVEQVDPATGTYRLDYDAADRRVGLEYPNGVTTEHEYDRASRLTLLLTRNPQGEVLDGYRYTYDPVGNRTSMRSLRDDVLHEYTYDAVDRLTRWQRGPERFEAYSYDAVGNRQQLEDERGTITYTYDDANRLLEELRTLTAGGQTTTTYQWDPNGNLLEEAVSTGSITTYTWDALNRLSQIDGPTGTHTYGYDPNGIRVRETNDGETTRFLHAGEDILATYETDQPDQPGQLATYFTHGPGIDEPWAQAQPGATEDPLAYLHRDGLGSVTATSTPEAQLRGSATYAAFGSVEASTGLQTRYGYTSRELDRTGLLYHRARYLSPGRGRFLSDDLVLGVAEEPKTLNGFDYSWGNPVRHTDPSGLSPRDDLEPTSPGARVWVPLVVKVFLSMAVIAVTFAALSLARRAFAAAILHLRALLQWMAGTAWATSVYFNIYIRPQFSRLNSAVRFGRHLLSRGREFFRAAWSIFNRNPREWFAMMTAIWQECRHFTPTEPPAGPPGLPDLIDWWSVIRCSYVVFLRFYFIGV